MGIDDIVSNGSQDLKAMSLEVIEETQPPIQNKELRRFVKKRVKKGQNKVDTKDDLVTASTMHNSINFNKSGGLTNNGNSQNVTK